MTNNKAVAVPELDHDAYMKKRYNQSVSMEGKAERKIVAHLCAHLLEHGFALYAVFDGDEYTEIHADAYPTKAAMELIFNLDSASLRVRKVVDDEDTEHGILLILGNGNIGCDMISDWTYSDGDSDGFNATMDAFKPEEILF